MSLEHDDDLGAMPCPETMIAATVALMTAWASPQERAKVDAPTQRALIAKKIVSNLFFLQHHPHVGESLRHVMANARRQWVGVVERDGRSVATVAPCRPTVLH